MPVTFEIPNQQHFSIREVARILDVSRSTIWEATKNGTIATIEVRASMFSPRIVHRIPRSEVVRLATERGLLQE